MNYYIGLMSGTSLDAIDAVLVSFPDEQPVLHHAINYPLSESLRNDIRALCTPGDNEIDRMGQLDIVLGNTFAAAVKQLLTDTDIDAAEIHAIGSHGQTIRHRPGLEKGHCFTLQIGDPNTIAELTGITTVADFRRRDMAVGGQGAPLVPAFHATFFGRDAHARIILNIGGMANVTLLPADTKTPASGFDTGPGNILMDSWIQQQQQQPFDHDGQWAASGTVNLQLLDSLLKDSFFRLAPPKSTGREHFNSGWLQQHLDKFEHTLTPVDVQATLSELTATSIANAIKKYAAENMELVVCGGGAHNADLMQRIVQKRVSTTVKTSGDYGLAAEWVEAVAFAWLARERLAQRPGNLPGVTGAHRPVVLGGIYPG
ncbi:MAG: anhydro-N-acetylmuramic acid kinase [Gammaproteobacteria bacterium]|nr:anhydro-N-acetylmuramic acid kinase [Gammaproteobacteria bacterium]